MDVRWGHSDAVVVDTVALSNSSVTHETLMTQCAFRDHQMSCNVLVLSSNTLFFRLSSVMFVLVLGK